MLSALSNVEEFYSYICRTTDLKLNDDQLQALRVMDSNSTTIGLAYRQWGKTLVSFLYAMYYACKNPHSLIIICELNRTGVKMEYFRENNLFSSFIGTCNKSRIWLYNGSRVLFRKYSLDCLRGFSAGVVIFDEFAYVPAADQMKIMQAACYGKPQHIIIPTTPNSNSDVVYDLWNNARSETLGRFRFTLDDGRNASTVSIERYDTEYLCKFRN